MAYRAIHDSIFDDPEFFTFSPDAKLVVFYLKLKLPATGIGPMTAGEISGVTGLSADRVSDSLSELVKSGWVRREATVMWLVRALEHDPHLNRRNVRHRKMLGDLISKLPKVKLIEQWRQKYSLSDSLPDTPSDTPSEEHSLSDSLSDSLYDVQETGDRKKGVVTPNEYLTPGESEGGTVAGFDYTLDEFLETIAARSSLRGKKRAQAIEKAEKIIAKLPRIEGDIADLTDDRHLERIAKCFGLVYR